MPIESENVPVGWFYCLEEIGETLLHWKRTIENWFHHNTPIVKAYLTISALVLVAYGGLALAVDTMTPQNASSFEVVYPIRQALAETRALDNAHVPLPIAAADLDYLQEIFTPVPSRQTTAELVARYNLRPPLPENLPDNGPAPLPGQASDSNRALAAFGGRSLLWPMRGGMVTSRFGMRWGRLHQGTDISAPYGTPILAAADGKVIFSGWEGGYGQLVIVDHGDGLKTKYGHCCVRLAKVGQVVEQGDILGKVGTTGHATGPHLHYEVLREGRATNPERHTRRR